LTAPRSAAQDRRWWLARQRDQRCAPRDSLGASHPAAGARRPRPGL